MCHYSSTNQCLRTDWPYAAEILFLSIRNCYLFCWYSYETCPFLNRKKGRMDWELETGGEGGGLGGGKEGKLCLGRKINEFIFKKGIIILQFNATNILIDIFNRCYLYTTLKCLKSWMGHVKRIMIEKNNMCVHVRVLVSV